MNDKVINPFFVGTQKNKTNSINIVFGSNAVVLVEGQVFRVRRQKMNQ
jgi:hypothetical protein